MPVYVTIGGTKSRDDSYADLCHQLTEHTLWILWLQKRDFSAIIPGHYHCSVLRTYEVIWSGPEEFPTPTFLLPNAIPPRLSKQIPHTNLRRPITRNCGGSNLGRGNKILQLWPIGIQHQVLRTLYAIFPSPHATHEPIEKHVPILISLNIPVDTQF